jgi:hypothetical protein
MVCEAVFRFLEFSSVTLHCFMHVDKRSTEMADAGSNGNLSLTIVDYSIYSPGSNNSLALCHDLTKLSRLKRQSRSAGWQV